MLRGPMRSSGIKMIWIEKLLIDFGGCTSWLILVAMKLYPSLLPLCACMEIVLVVDGVGETTEMVVCGSCAHLHCPCGSYWKPQLITGLGPLH